MTAFADKQPAATARARSVFGSSLAVGAYLVLLTVFSAWFRTRSATGSFWMDEGLSVGIASHPLGDIPGLLKQDGSPPLYYMALGAWMGAVGRTEANTHLFSMLASLLCIPVAFFGMRTMFSRRAGVIAASLFASSAFLSSYSQETRMYSLVALLSLMTSVCFLLAFVARRRFWLVGFALSQAAMLYTHGWGIFFGVGCAAAFLYLLIAEPNGRRRLVVDGLLGFGAVAMMFLPWLPTLLYQSQHTAAPWALSPDLGVPIQIGFLLGGQRIAFLLLIAAALGVQRILAGNSVGVPENPSLKGSLDPLGTKRALVVLLVIFLVTIAVGWTVSQFNPAWVLRYLAAVLGPLLLAFAVGAARSGAVGIAAVAIAVLSSFSPSINRDVNVKSNVRNIGTEVNPLLKKGALVIVAQPEQTPLVWYYLPGGMRYADPMGATSDPRMLNWVDVVDRLRAADPKTTWNKLADTVPVGGQVLLVRPLTVGISNWSAPWTFLVRRRSAQWSELLQSDPRFVREAAAPSFYIPAVTVADSAVLYRRISGR